MNREPIPPGTSRQDALGQLKRERWHAANAGEAARVEQLDRQIAQLSSAGTATPPTRETATQTTAARQTSARTTPKPAPTKGKRHVRPAR